jgi:UPF0755 protein
MKLFKIIILIVVLGLAGYFYLNYLYQKHLTTPFREGVSEVTQIQIEQGSSLNQIAKILDQKNIIEFQWVFKWYVQKQNLSQKLQAGTYYIAPNLTILEITDILVGNTKSQMKITIPEGYTISQIDQLLSQKGILETGEFITKTNTYDPNSYSFLNSLNRKNRLEGYLFPDTYFIDLQQFNADLFLTMLLNNFQNQISNLTEDINQQQYNLDQIINMAAMIEREASTDKERPIIAGILWKRLENRIPLGVDATLRYGLNNWEKSLTVSDLKNDNPYNTRIYPGLPPAPIANPGLKSIKAAINPEKSPYYYYLHDSDGNIHYAKTLEEHVKNKEQYLR